MTYDLHGSWDHKIGHNSPLYAGPWDQTALEKQLNVDAAISYWIQNGAPPEKILLGVPSYARGFRMVNGQSTPGSPHAGPSDPGPYTATPGMMGFNEICEKRKSEKWEDHWDDKQFVPYTTKGSQWLGYDDEKSLRLKVNYVHSHNLGGVMMWSIETDDFKGFCGRGTFPLLKEINSSLLGLNVSTPHEEEDFKILYFAEKQKNNSLKKFIHDFFFKTFQPKYQKFVEFNLLKQKYFYESFNELYGEYAKMISDTYRSEDNFL